MDATPRKKLKYNCSSSSHYFVVETSSHYLLQKRKKDQLNDFIIHLNLTLYLLNHMQFLVCMSGIDLIWIGICFDMAPHTKWNG